MRCFWGSWLALHASFLTLVKLGCAEMSLSKFENFLFACNDICNTLLTSDGLVVSNTTMFGLGGGLGLYPVPRGGKCPMH